MKMDAGLELYHRKPKQATADELAHNSRSKSAKLRIAEKLDTADDQEETRKEAR